MTKLEQKLIELGYEYNEIFDMWKKEILKNTIRITFGDGQTFLGEVANLQNVVVTTQQQIDDLQQAFNTMQKDLEILKKECEE